MSDRSEKIIPINASTNDNTVEVGQPVDVEYKPPHNDNSGGDVTMDNRYVTHEELSHAVDKLDAKIDFSTEKLSHQMYNLASSLKESHQADINSVKNSLTQTNLKISIIVGVITSIGVPIVTAILLKFLHLR